jgi:fucose 4-O-acetylase-like acetyltransferase
MKNRYLPLDIKPSSGRIAYIDALRCFAILFVIEGHVWILGMGISSYDMLSGLMLYSFYLPLFFFISGFLAYKTNISFKESLLAIKKKIVLLVIPAIFFRVAMNLIHNKNVCDILYTGFGKYWFTITLFECFCIYYLSHQLIRKERLRIILLCLISIAFIFLLSKSGNIGPKLIDTNHLFKSFYFFVIGLLAKKYSKMYELLLSNEYVRAGVILGFFVLLFTINNPIWPNSLFHLMRDVVLRVLGTWIIVILFVSNSHVFEKPCRLNTIISEIGKKSLPIYLLQYFFIPDLKGLYECSINVIDEINIHLIAIIYTVFVLIACFSFIYILEQSKYIRKYILGEK